MACIIRIDEISTPEQFLSLEGIWREVFSNSRSDNVFLTWEWVSSWVETYGFRHPLHTLVVYRDNQPVGIAPWYRDLRRERFSLGRAGLGPAGLALRQIRFIGDQGAGSEYLDILAVQGYEQEVWRVLLSHLELDRQNWDILFLDDMSGSSPSIPILKALAPLYALRFLQRRKNVCPFIPLPESFEVYKFQQANPHQVKATERKLKRLRKSHHQMNWFVWPGSDITLNGQLEEALSTLFELHQKRRHSKGQRGSFADPLKREFYRRVAHRLAAKGWLRLYTLEVDNRVLSASIGLLYRGRYSFLNSGFDPDWASYGPGSVLKYLEIQDLIQQGVKIYDFLRGDEDYKYRWGAIPHFTYTLLIGRRHWKVEIFWLLKKLKGALRRQTLKQANP